MSSFFPSACFCTSVWPRWLCAYVFECKAQRKNVYVPGSLYWAVAFVWFTPLYKYTTVALLASVCSFLIGSVLSPAPPPYGLQARENEDEDDDEGATVDSAVGSGSVAESTSLNLKLRYEASSATVSTHKGSFSPWTPELNIDQDTTGMQGGI